MYDRPIKWIHLGLQESSLVNSDIYSYGFEATIPPPVKQRAGMSDLPDTVRGVICFSSVAKTGGVNRPPVQVSANFDWLLCQFLFLGKEKETKTRHLYTNPTSLISFQGNEAEPMRLKYSEGWF